MNETNDETNSEEKNIQRRIEEIARGHKSNERFFLVTRHETIEGTTLAEPNMVTWDVTSRVRSDIPIDFEGLSEDSPLTVKRGHDKDTYFIADAERARCIAQENVERPDVRTEVKNRAEFILRVLDSPHFSE